MAGNPGALPKPSAMCVGGTKAEAWTPQEVLQGYPEYKDILDDWEMVAKQHPGAMPTYQKKLEE